MYHRRLRRAGGVTPEHRKQSGGVTPESAVAGVQSGGVTPESAVAAGRRCSLSWHITGSIGASQEASALF